MANFMVYAINNSVVISRELVAVDNGSFSRQVAKNRVAGRWACINPKIQFKAFEVEIGIYGKLSLVNR